jgi:predicted DNA-binding ribbon-helix-helix protein
MKSSVINRSIVFDNRRTSVSVEEAFWQGLREIAEGRNETLCHLISTIDKERPFANLSSAIRLFVLHHYRDKFQKLPKHMVAQGQSTLAPENLITLPHLSISFARLFPKSLEVPGVA